MNSKEGMEKIHIKNVVNFNNNYYFSLILLVLVCEC